MKHLMSLRPQRILNTYSGRENGKTGSWGDPSFARIGRRQRLPHLSINLDGRKISIRQEGAE